MRFGLLAAAALAAACSPFPTSHGGTGTGTASVTVRNLAAVVWTARFVGDSGATAALVIPGAKLCWRDVPIPNTLELLSTHVVFAPFLTDTGGVEVRINADTTLDVVLGTRQCA